MIDYDNISSSTAVSLMLEENERRKAKLFAPFNPVTGEHSIGEREHVVISDISTPDLWLPKPMLDVQLTQEILDCGSFSEYLRSIDERVSPKNIEELTKDFIRLRNQFDYPFWAYMFVKIKNKMGGEDIPMKLNFPQRRLTSLLEEMRLTLTPLRLYLLKARQWGGSTNLETYIAWYQLVLMKGLNSIIVAHVMDASSEVRDMYQKLIDNYPVWLLHDIGELYAQNESKLVGVHGTQNIQLVPQRNCKIKIGSAERPNSARGGDSALAHCTETAFWKTTDGKTPEEIVRSATSGIMYLPNTLIAYESTANSAEGMFHDGYMDAYYGRTQFRALFIPWFEAEKNFMPMDDPSAFALNLLNNRNSEEVFSSRVETGKYLFHLWLSGATLEGINWYITERTKVTDHADMAAEAPTDHTEAFRHSGSLVFDIYEVDKFRPACRPPKFIGDVIGNDIKGDAALENLHFVEQQEGLFWVWRMPEYDPDYIISDRYIVIVDVGGRSAKADWSVIVVIDRYWLMEDGKPTVVAQWYGHVDHDLLAWKAAQIAKFYDNALLVIESNTPESDYAKRPEQLSEGDQVEYILQQIKDAYDNLYERKASADKIKEGRSTMYGFHTNKSTKPKIIDNLIAVLREHSYVERDARCLDEYCCYEKKLKPKGAYGAVDGKHDDLLMTRAIGLWISEFEMDKPAMTKRIVDQPDTVTTNRNDMVSI